MKARLGLTALEDRTTPTAVVTVEAVGQAVEGDSSVVSLFRFTRTETAGALPISYTTSGTSDSSDYAQLYAIEFADGEATADLYVYAHDDSTAEGTETLVVTLVAGTGYTVGGLGSDTLNICDAGTPVVTVTKIADATEGGTGGTFRFSRTGNLTQAIAVNYNVTGTATNTVDYNGLPAQINFGIGVDTVDIPITAVNDGMVEPDETATVTLAAGGYTVGNPSAATMTIVNRAWLVNTTGDGEDANLGNFVPDDAGGNVSLRAAVMQANANGAVLPGARYEIAFADALFQPPGGGPPQLATITLTNGTLPAFVTGIDIAGPGMNLLKIVGTGNAGMVKVDASSTSSLKSLTLSGGTNAGPGGGIDNAGDITLTAVRITGCTADEGGGIFTNNRVALTGCEISNNDATGAANGYGGGISLTGAAVLTASGTTITDNRSVVRGGGIALRGNSQATLTSSFVTLNRADSGAGVYNSGATFSMTGGSLSNNTSRASGGGLETGGTTTLHDVQIRNNSAVQFGGGINLQAGTFSMTGSQGLVDNNRAANGGGIHQVGGTGTVQDVTISNNTVTEWGGGLYSSGGSITFTATTFAGNQATLGGAKIAKKTNNPTITVGLTCVGVAQIDVETDPRP